MSEQTNKKKKENFDIRVLVTMSLMVALEVILSRLLSYSVWNIKIGLSFIPVVLTAIMYGPFNAAIVGGLADLIGAIVFPVGTYFPGFTYTAALKGFIFGVFLYKRTSIMLIIGAVMTNQLVLSLVLNTYWISMLYNSAFEPLLLTRIIQIVIMIPVQILVILSISKILSKYFVRNLKNYRSGEV